jgi:hypothetical protein
MPFLHAVLPVNHQIAPDPEPGNCFGSLVMEEPMAPFSETVRIADKHMHHTGTSRILEEVPGSCGGDRNGAIKQQNLRVRRVSF